ncbi:plastocyanin/azurin family copper-binding protein [Candidatus Nitrososphaera sp. FF02]|jgi:plastocyanin|uniref:cupredoxin domain-containing protein n=1 Tax=Candidatus Nitrososphaera sp. FF02 TaxID=3398226 RepID=UPI002F9E0B45
MTNHAGGISVIAFVIAVGVSIGYYQFMYIPAVNAKPILKEEILNPPNTAQVTIVPGASLEATGRSFEPKALRTTIEIDNRVQWTNNDGTSHTVTSDTYVDKINGKFDTMDTIGLIPPGGTFEFTFTAVGTYEYYCVPHPHMSGEVEVIENFA